MSGEIQPSRHPQSLLDETLGGGAPVLRAQQATCDQIRSSPDHSSHADRNASAQDLAGTEIPAPGRRVLVAEDDLVNQVVAVRLLEKHGFRVEVASNAREAVRMHASAGYDLILMDCQMPELDGYAATAEIRRGEPPGAHVPIIAPTANAPEGERERCLAAGMNEYVAKPLRPANLEAIIALAFAISDDAVAA